MTKAKAKAGRKEPFGRPTKYEPAWMDRALLDLMSEGASIIEVAAALQVHPDTIYEWAKTKQDFSVTFQNGKRLSQAWWEKKGRVNLENTSFQTGLWYANMKNRFGWRDKQDVAHSGEIHYTVTELDDGVL